LVFTGKPEHANTKNEDEFLAMLTDGGFQVGELAKLMYPDGVDIKTNDVADVGADHSITYPTTTLRAQKYRSSGFRAHLVGTLLQRFSFPRFVDLRKTLNYSTS
jgi:hypothetical protein